MWGPLKDTGKEGFSVRRQAEKQQPVYRLILLCAPNFVAASCEAPPLSFSSVSAQPHRPPSLPTRFSASHFLRQRHAWGHSLNRNRFVWFAVIFFHWTSVFLYHVWKLNSEAIVKRRMSSLFGLCFVTLLCVLLALYRLSLFCLANSQYNSDKKHF